MKASVLFRIDNPEDRVIRTAMCVIRGWCASYDRSAVDNIRFEICGRQLPWRPEDRPDVAQAHPDKASLGFRIDLDLNEHLHAVQGNMLTITALPHESLAIPAEFSLEKGVVGDCLVAAAGA